MPYRAHLCRTTEDCGGGGRRGEQGESDLAFATGVLGPSATPGVVLSHVRHSISHSLRLPHITAKMPDNVVQSPYPLIDADPHFSRVVRYMRPSDYTVWAGATAAFPSAIYFWGT